MPRERHRSKPLRPGAESDHGRARCWHMRSKRPRKNRSRITLSCRGSPDRHRPTRPAIDGSCISSEADSDSFGTASEGFRNKKDKDIIMTEYYEAALATDNVTLVYGLIGLLFKLTSFVVSMWTIHRDRKRVDKLIADTKAELEKYRAERDH